MEFFVKNKFFTSFSKSCSFTGESKTIIPPPITAKNPPTAVKFQKYLPIPKKIFFQKKN